VRKLSAAQQARNKVLQERISTLEAALEIVQEELRAANARAETAEAECERLRGTINDMTEHQVVLGYEIERLRAALAAGKE
jgi:uncharacterized protein (UPF0335 family)